MSKKKSERTITIEASVPKDYKIEYWYDRDQEMPESEQEHVKEMIEQGYVEGQLIYVDPKDRGNNGWWKIHREQDEL